MQRKSNFSIGEYYHIYSRGTDKRKIFLDKKDFQRFKILLYRCNSLNSFDVQKLFRSNPTLSEIFNFKSEKDFLVDIGAYCLMPNHFHLLIREKTEKGISKFLSRLLTSYSMYFNKKNNRTGCLFESRFKAKHVNNDNYLKYLFAYIHLNPVKMIDPNWKENKIINRAKAKEHLSKYNFSSYLDYQGIPRYESKIISWGAFPEYFDKGKEFDHFLNDWLLFSDSLNEE